MIKNYLLISFRNLFRQKFFSLINIFGFAAGLTVVLLITLFVTDELSFDKFHAKKDRLYRVVENQYYSGQPVFPVAVTPNALGPALVTNYPEIINATRASGTSRLFVVGDKKFIEDGGLYVDEAFFDVFTFPLVKGDPLKVLQRQDAVVISEALAEKYFGGEDPVGKTIMMEDVDEAMEVTGVMKNIPANSHIDFDYCISIRNFFARNPGQESNWGSNRLYTYVELSESANLDEVNAKIIGEIKKNNQGSVTDIYLQPLTDIYLGSVQFTVEVSRKGEMLYVEIFSFVAIFILLIACINFMNLSTAKSGKRAKEVGLRKAVGAGRGQLVLQFLGESVITTLIALMVAILAAYLLLPFFNNLAEKQLNLDLFGSWGNGLNWLLLILVTAVLTGILAGSYPAFVLSGFKPVKVLKSTPDKVRGGVSFRKILVVTQFTVSVTLIIGMMVVSRQLRYIQSKNLGYNKENVLLIERVSNNQEAFDNELLSQNSIISIGRSNRHPAYVMSSTSGFSWPGKNPDETILIHYMGVDDQFMSTMGMTMSEGRILKEGDSISIVINEQAQKIMGLKDPVGQVINDGQKDLTIVGVVNDFHFKSIHTAIEPLIMYMPTRFFYTFVRIRAGEENEAIALIEREWSKLNPDQEFVYRFLDEDFNNLYAKESRTEKISVYLSVLAVIISCLGLFGLVSYSAAQRTKEIGIRKVMGAPVANLFILVSKDFTILVLISYIIALPVSWYLMRMWLSGFAYHTTISVTIYVVAAVATFAIGLLSVSYQALKAATADPVKSLRYE